MRFNEFNYDQNHPYNVWEQEKVFIEMSLSMIVNLLKKVEKNPSSLKVTRDQLHTMMINMVTSPTSGNLKVFDVDKVKSITMQVIKNYKSISTSQIDKLVDSIAPPRAKDPNKDKRDSSNSLQQTLNKALGQ